MFRNQQYFSNGRRLLDRQRAIDEVKRQALLCEAAEDPAWIKVRVIKRSALLGGSLSPVSALVFAAEGELFTPGVVFKFTFFEPATGLLQSRVGSMHPCPCGRRSRRPVLHTIVHV